VVTTAPAPILDRPRQSRRVAWAAVVGTSLESYDFYIFAYFSAFFLGPLFFEPLGPFGRTLASFLTIAIGFVIRPVGAIVFGHLGDRIGRRRTLLITVAIMGVATGLVGLLPTYATAGALGGVLLVLLRLLQGFSLGGEWGGAVLIATEHSDGRRRAFRAALPQLGSPVGSILAAAVFLLLTTVMGQDALASWGWRIPFLTAIPLLLVSLYLRVSIDESPVFKAVASAGRRDTVPLVALLRRQPVAVIVAIATSLLGIGSYALMNTYTLNYGVAELGFAYRDLLVATTIGGLLQLVTIPLFGWWATKIGSARVVAIGAVGTLVISAPIYWLLQSADFGVLVGMMVIGGILPTLSWAALGGALAEMFDADIRYSALSVAYSIGAVISGFVPAITLALGNATSFAWWHPAIVLGVMSAVTLVGAILAARLKRVDPVEAAVIEQ
jgi:MFS family permease